MRAFKKCSETNTLVKNMYVLEIMSSNPKDGNRPHYQVIKVIRDEQNIVSLVTFFFGCPAIMCTPITLEGIENVNDLLKTLIPSKLAESLTKINVWCAAMDLEEVDENKLLKRTHSKLLHWGY